MRMAKTPAHLTYTSHTTTHIKGKNIKVHGEEGVKLGQVTMPKEEISWRQLCHKTAAFGNPNLTKVHGIKKGEVSRQ